MVSNLQFQDTLSAELTAKPPTTQSFETGFDFYLLFKLNFPVFFSLFCSFRKGNKFF